MTPVNVALFRAICLHPDEDTPRLAYADWLEEQGESTHARFIRTQIALARLTEYDAAAITLRREQPDALTGWGMAHTLPVVPPGYSWSCFEFRRGFPWNVNVASLAAFSTPDSPDTGDATIFDTAPIQSLEFHYGDRGDRPLHVALTQWPHLAQIQRLKFGLTQLEGRPLEQLGNSPHCGQLRELCFQFDALTADGLAALAGSPLFPRIQTLEVSANLFPPALLVDALAAAREPGALARLTLMQCHLSRYDADALFGLPLIRELSRLNLTDNPLGVEGARALAESGTVRGLRMLNLERTVPGVAGVRAIAEAGGAGGLRSLNLASNRLGPVAVSVLADSGIARGLRVLNLANNPIGNRGVETLAQAKSLRGLYQLDLADADITDPGALALAESPYLDEIVSLNLVNRRIGRALGKVARAALRDRFGDRVLV